MSSVDEMKWYVFKVFMVWKDKFIVSIMCDMVKDCYMELVEKGLNGRKGVFVSVNVLMVMLCIFFNFVMDEYCCVDGKVIIDYNLVGVFKYYWVKLGMCIECYIDKGKVGVVWNKLMEECVILCSCDVFVGIDLIIFFLLIGVCCDEVVVLMWLNVYIEDDFVKCWWYLDDCKCGDFIWLLLFM